MRLVLRPLAPRETDYELLWLSFSLGSVAFVALWFRLRLPWPICAFHALTGHPCPTCGATRAAIALLQGHLRDSWRWNPLACTAYCVLGLGSVYALIGVVTGSRRWRLAEITRGEGKFVRALIVALILANWIYLLHSLPR